MSGCGNKERIQPLFPPAADVKAAIEPKPVAPVEIVTSAQAAAEYDIAVEAWGGRVRDAGARICRWAVANGAVYTFPCPPRPSQDAERR